MKSNDTQSREIVSRQKSNSKDNATNTDIEKEHTTRTRPARANKPDDEAYDTIKILPKSLDLDPESYGQSRALSGMELHAPLVLCAEPGMGKSFVAGWIMRCARNEGWSVRQYSFDTLPSDKVARKVVRACRSLSRSLAEGAHILLVIDGLTPPDEWECSCEVRALERFHGAGGRIVLCIRPEAEQLAEGLTGCSRLETEDLLIHIDDHEGTDWDLTGGIPALVMARKTDEAMKLPRSPGSHYLKALDELVVETIRPELPLEDLRLRFAALLLGMGTMEELASASGRCDAEQFAWLSRDVPLLEVDVATRTFVVHGMGSDDIFSMCLGTMQGFAALYPEVVVRSSAILASRGSVGRSATVCALCSSERDFALVGCSWGVSYVEVGEMELVDRALRTAKELGLGLDACAQMSEAAVTALMGTAAQRADIDQRMEVMRLASFQEQRAFHRAWLISACRDVWDDPQHIRDCSGVSVNDEAGIRLMEHLRIAKLLVEGRFCEAYSTMSNEVLLREVDGLGAALLSDDLMLALLLSGGVPDARERRLFADADRFFAQTHLDRMRAYHAAFCALPRILMGPGHDLSALEDAASKADRAGDRYLQALFLAVMAVGDLRVRAWSRAHVRCERAARVAQQLQDANLLSAATLMDSLAVELLGEHGALVSWCHTEGHPRELALLGTVAAREAGELSGGDIEFIVPTSTPCPNDALWMLNTLTSDCMSLTKSIVEGMPATWLDRMRAIRLRQGAALFGQVDDVVPVRELAYVPKSAETLEAGTQAQLMPQPSQATRVRVSVLGGFCVEVDGRLLPDSLFERRRSRDLIVLLAIVGGHRLRRYQVIDILWPDTDYFRGPRKLYEATGEARKQLGYYLDGLNPLVADRLQGTIGFDVALVGSDVDEFEREARMTLTEDGDDFWILDHARRMERLYGSGPDPHLRTLGEHVVERMEEMKTLYVDAAVAAGEAALRLGKTKLAVRYASDAYRLRDLREDVVILLVQALKAAGRGFEVAPIYRQFSRRLIEEEGVPPSLALRRAVALASEDGPEVLTS